MAKTVLSCGSSIYTACISNFSCLSSNSLNPVCYVADLGRLVIDNGACNKSILKALLSLAVKLKMYEYTRLDVPVSYAATGCWHFPPFYHRKRRYYHIIRVVTCTRQLT